MKEFRLSISVDLPDDYFEAAELIAKLRAPWQAVVEQVNVASGVVVEYVATIVDHSFDEVTVPTLPSAGNGSRRARPGRPAGSKNRQPHQPASTPMLAPAFPPEPRE